ncbi:PD40 domain-containing protein [Aquimarina sp. Aq78]|uniref:PD40 domain-containing protein n=1 Tax=Aquimarina sp. Aq78 TaxID=1191889 RepID=UPI000D0F188F|nr:PD40 domain-containing protein [Aquimarina sp. Aq78]
MKRRYYFLSMIAFVFILQSCKPINSNNSYIDEKLPGIVPELFAPSFVNTNAIEINTVFNASFTEMFFTRIIDGSFIIHHSNLINGKWAVPQPIQMYTDQKNESVAIDPSITQDGDTMYFLGVSPEDRLKKGKPDIYRSQKIDGKWQIASKVGYPVSTEKYVESYPVVVADGSIYFTSNRPGGLGKGDIYRAQYLGEGKFDTPMNIGSEVNSEEGQRGTYVAPDESYLITGNTYTDEKGFAISFKKNNKWQVPVHLDIGEPLKKDWIYFCPYMSPDGKYFFFSKRYSNPPKSGWKGVTKGEVYWVDVNTVFKDQRK